MVPTTYYIIVSAILFVIGSLGVLIRRNAILIPRYGAWGAAVASLVSFAIAGYLYNAFSPQTRHLFRLSTYSLLPPLRFLVRFFNRSREERS